MKVILGKSIATEQWENNLLAVIFPAEFINAFKYSSSVIGIHVIDKDTYTKFSFHPFPCPKEYTFLFYTHSVYTTREKDIKSVFPLHDRLIDRLSTRNHWKNHFINVNFGIDYARLVKRKRLVKSLCELFRI